MTSEGQGEQGEREARQAVLALVVLDDVDLVPRDDGVLVQGPRDVHLTWQDVSAAAAGAPSGSRVSRRRLLREVALHRALGEPECGAVHLLGLPAGRVPDPEWALERVPGGVLAVGLGVDLRGM